MLAGEELKSFLGDNVSQTTNTRIEDLNEKQRVREIDKFFAEKTMTWLPEMKIERM